MNRGKPKLALTSETAIGDLSDRTPPYWNILEYCRHLGIQKAADQPIYRVARIRRKDGGYKQTRLGVAIDESGWVTNRETAIQLAQAWFASSGIAQVAAKSYPVGVTRTLHYDKKADGFTVGDAMKDYVEWKRIAATRSHSETMNRSGFSGGSRSRKDWSHGKRQQSEPLFTRDTSAGRADGAR